MITFTKKDLDKLDKIKKLVKDEKKCMEYVEKLTKEAETASSSRQKEIIDELQEIRLAIILNLKHEHESKEKEERDKRSETITVDGNEYKIATTIQDLSKEVYENSWLIDRFKTVEEFIDFMNQEDWTHKDQDTELFGDYNNYDSDDYLGGGWLQKEYQSLYNDCVLMEIDEEPKREGWCADCGVKDPRDGKIYFVYNSND